MIPVKSLANPHSERKRLGKFYTPESLSRILTDWAIQVPSDKILEPSFGGCGFLAAARSRLETLGSKSSKSQIFGCDIDANAFQFLVDVLGGPVDTDRFKQEDFLDIQPQRYWPHLFEVTIGNPPYIPFQAIPEKRRENTSEFTEKMNVTIGKRASLWAYFLIHAVSFVAPKGRMAWVLPGAFLQADYAVAVREFLSRSFESVLCVLMHQRFFKAEGTEEETVIVLAKNRYDLSIPNDIAFASASTLDELPLLIESWEHGPWVGQTLNARPSYLAAEDSVINLFESVQSHYDCRKLADFLRVNIGLVTGANTFFVLTEEKRKALRLNDGDTVPVLAKFEAARGLALSAEDHAIYLKAGGRGHLVQTKVLPPKSTPLRRYLDTFKEEQRAKIKTFKKRSIWHSPDDGKVPDAFLSVMNHNGPRLVLNDAGINCTNTIHRAFFTSPMDGKNKKLLVVSVLTSFSQLSAEFVGRRYGSGVLKHEPRDAEKISVLFPQDLDAAAVDAAFDEIDGLLRVGNLEGAQARADNLLLHALDNGEAISSAFRAALSSLRELRRSTRYLLGA